MHSIKEIQLLCNKQFIINFDGGELSSDGGLLMIKEFLHTLGFEKLLKNSFKTNDMSRVRIHKDDENLLQMIYQILGPDRRQPVRKSGLCLTENMQAGCVRTICG